MIQEEPPLCYYCFEAIDVTHPNVSPQPCNCKGSITLHDSCYKTYIYKQGRCGICKQKFHKLSPNVYIQPRYVHYKTVDTTLHKYEDDFLRYTWTNHGNGTYTEYHNNNTIYKIIESYSHGMFLGLYHGFVKNSIHGHFQKFYDNGQCKVDCYYDHNILHGPYKEYDREGQLLEELYYTEGLLHGLCTWIKGPYRIKQIRLYEKGVLQKRRHKNSLEL